jgi:asparagine synthase (glutamine-hydrolysing)
MGGLMFDTGSTLSMSAFNDALARLAHRGPDSTRVLGRDCGVKLGAHLAATELNRPGDQPFVDEEGLCYAVCDGSFYNQRSLRAALNDRYPFRSRSGGELLSPLYREHGLQGMLDRLDGDYAFVLYDAAQSRCIAARDASGLRPLFFGFERRSGRTLFASEAKALHAICGGVYYFPPGHVSDNGRFREFQDPGESPALPVRTMSSALAGIRDHLAEAVRKRLEVDAPIGVLLSGSLESNLVGALAQQLSPAPVQTFAVGTDPAESHMRRARQTAEVLGCRHHEVLFTEQEALGALGELIAQLESWDLTTVRRGLGVYLLARYLRTATPIRILVSASGVDELLAPSPDQATFSPDLARRSKQDRLRRLQQHQLLLLDRCLSAQGLEARVPGCDPAFLRFVMSIEPTLWPGKSGAASSWLREAFAGTELLPESILWADSASSLPEADYTVARLIENPASIRYSDDDFARRTRGFAHCPPHSKESLLYREIFELHYPDRAGWVEEAWHGDAGNPGLAQHAPAATI